jgi:hypothetical protein
LYKNKIEIVYTKFFKNKQYKLLILINTNNG